MPRRGQWHLGEQIQRRAQALVGENEDTARDPTWRSDVAVAEVLVVEAVVVPVGMFATSVLLGVGRSKCCFT